MAGTRPYVVLAVLLSSSVGVHAQTNAQKALSGEPEIRQLSGIAADLRVQQRLPDDAVGKLPPLSAALQGFIGLRSQMALLDQLEGRLDAAARACQFCAAKQEELSELIRERLIAVDAISSAWGPSGGVFSGSAPLELRQLFGAAPTASRWTDQSIAANEVAPLVAEHCRRPGAVNEEVCRPTPQEGAFKLAGEREATWVACFGKNDWVADAAHRVAFETCLKSSDPFLKLCAAEHQTPGGAGSCTPLIVTYADVGPLRGCQVRNCTSRWITDPTRLDGGVTVISQQPMHVTVLESIVMPAAAPGSKQIEVTVRGRLENPLWGTSTRADGKAILIQPGTELPIKVNLMMKGTQANGGTLSLRAQYEQRMVFLPSMDILHEVPWPVAGTVLVPADTSLPFATACGCNFMMALSSFREQAAESAAAAAAPARYRTRPVLAGSRLETILLEPIDTAGIIRGRGFHAQLNVDLELPRGSKRSDAVLLPRGTDVYLKITGDNNNPRVDHNANLSIDYVVVDGQRVPLRTAAWTHTFSAPVLNLPNTRRPSDADVIWPKGHTKWFDVLEEVDIPAAGSILPTTPPQPTTAAAAAPPPAATPASAGAAAPATAGSTNVAPRGLALPTGTALRVATVDVISLDTIERQSKYLGRLTEPVVAAGQTLIPAGAEVTITAILRPTLSGMPPGTQSIGLTIESIVIDRRTVRLPTTEVIRNIGPSNGARGINVGSRGIPAGTNFFFHAAPGDK